MDGRYNIKNPAGDFVQRESNVDVVRQVSLARVAMQKTQREEEKQRLAAEETGVEEVSHGTGRQSGSLEPRSTPVRE